MKHKYIIQRNVEKKILAVREYAELDKDMLSLVCEETYPDATLEAAIAGENEALLKAIRTENFYPPKSYANGIVRAIIGIYNAKNNTVHELIFNDQDYITGDAEEPKEDEVIEKKSTDIDDLLEENFDDQFDEKEEIDNINSSLKVADDETLNIEDSS